MIGLDRVRSLEEDWRESLDAVARRHRWPTSHDVDRLGSRVVELSQAYNDPDRARAAIRDAGAARLGFSFARDVSKGAAAVRELVVGGRLTAPLRLLDVGSGLGAMTWGALRAMSHGGAALAGPEAIDVTWLDEDRAALELGLEIVRERGSPWSVRTVAGSVDALDGLGRFDLVLAGHVLSEVGVGDDEASRVERQAGLLDRLLTECLEENGALVVVEPALRDRTRRLHRVRDVLVRRGWSVLAPCLHASPCPALARDSDWCHEDLPVDLPEWLWPVARVAGLRREGLTFSYLALGRDPLRRRDSGRPPALRVVSGCMATKGKSEAFLCGTFRTPAGEAAVARARVTRLDRNTSAANESWNHVGRGDVLCVEPALELERPRITRETRVTMLDDGEWR